MFCECVCVWRALPRKEEEEEEEGEREEERATPSFAPSPNKRHSFFFGELTP